MCHQMLYHELASLPWTYCLDQFVMQDATSADGDSQSKPGVNSHRMLYLQRVNSRRCSEMN